MSFIEVISIISDFYFVFVLTAAFISVIAYAVIQLVRNKNVVADPGETAISERESRIFSCVHNVKILPEFFEGVINGTKPFEFRNNDRGYKPGDCVCLKECIIDADREQIQEIYTGRYCFVVIKDIFELGDIDPNFSDYVIFTFSILRIIKGEE